MTEVAPHDKQAFIIDRLLNGRDLATLKALAPVCRKRPGMAYDPETLAARARRRIEQAFTAAHWPTQPGPGGPVVLEIGCGRAENAKYVMACGGRRYIGIDPDTTLALSHPGLEADAEILAGTAENLPVPTDSIDLVISFNVLEHVPDPRAGLQEIVRVLRPGGNFFTVFGPPFNAPAGPHLTRFIDLPYMHHLFPESVVSQFTGRTDPYVTVNKRPLSFYRQTFFAEDAFHTTMYREHVTGTGFWLLKSRGELGVNLALDELGVSAITALVNKPA